MNYDNLGQTFSASKLTLGGGGIGQVWGQTDRQEAIATVELAVTSGINLFDLAPLYGDGEAERVVGQVFAGGYPEGVHLTTKCMLGAAAPDDINHNLRRSLDQSCERLGRNYVDVFILHGYVVADGWQSSLRPEVQARVAVSHTNFSDYVVPVFEALKKEGRIGAWGVTAASTQDMNLQVLNGPSPPDVVQCISNLLDSPGGMAISDEPPAPRAVIARASELGIGVMGIRAVCAGALTESLDRKVHPKSGEQRDFNRATKFRELAASLSRSPSWLAHQYAASMPGVDTLVLGVKNREELHSALQAEAAGAMSQALMAELEACIQ